MNKTVLALFIVVVLFGAYVFQTKPSVVLGLPKLRQTVQNKTVNVLILLASNYTEFQNHYDGLVSFPERINQIFYGTDDMNVNDFYAKYNDGMSFNVHTDVMPAYEANYTPVMPICLWQRYFTEMDLTERQTYESCNIVFIMASNKTYFQTQPYYWVYCSDGNAELMMFLSINDQRYLFAHEFAHWFGIGDRYGGRQDPNDPDSQHDVMNMWSWEEATHFSGLDLQEMEYWSLDWTKVGTRYCGWFYDPFPYPYELERLT